MRYISRRNLRFEGLLNGTDFGLNSGGLMQGGMGGDEQGGYTKG